jgi:thiamine biosynthesis lipoprotein
MRMNRAAAREGWPRPTVEVSPELFHRLLVSRRVAELTGGLFDPTVGPVVRALGFLPRETGSRSHAIGWQKIELASASSAVRFDSPGMEVDLGGIAKGYAAGRAAAVLREHGIRNALVSLGGSSMSALGKPTDCAACRGWPVMVRDPRDEARAAAWLELRDGESLATSGTYENTHGEGKKRVSHIIDPRSRRPIGGEISVTVLLDDAEQADALTKPFFFLPSLHSPEAAGIMGRFPAASVMLIRARQGRLVREAAGASPERFVPADSRATRSFSSHVAETR